MDTEITDEILASLKGELDSHPVYDAIVTIEDLQCFMEHHVYSVWDFMSLAKYLQSIIAPTSYPWFPQREGNARRFINEIILEEESDKTLVSGRFASHFELYQQAMAEIGANTQQSTQFIESVQSHGIEVALSTSSTIPTPSRIFTTKTFELIKNNTPHQTAAAFALGREHIVPIMFRAILRKIKISETQAPTFHFYLKRHVGLDEERHGPSSLRLLNQLCASDKHKVQEAIETAQIAVQVRIQFWDGVLQAIKTANSNRQQFNSNILLQPSYA